MAQIILGVSSSISIYKALEVVSLLKKENHSVFTMLSHNAKKLISPLLFETLSENPSLEEVHVIEGKTVIPHINLARKGDLLVFAPATANLIAKMAQGISDNFLMDVFLAFKGQVLVFPAMNPNMWNHKTTQKNVEILKSYGVHVFNPTCGLVACGEEGVGKLESPENIVARIKEFLAKNEVNNTLPKKKALVALGAAFEPLDPVRVITNLSSGKMGVALINSLHAKGYSVTALYGAITQEIPHFVETKQHFTTNEDLEEKIKSHLKENYDVFIMVAAPCDFELKEKQTHKIKKENEITLSFVSKKDILKNLPRPKNTLFVGFAAETENLKQRAKEKLKNKELNIIIGNTAFSENEQEVGIGKENTDILILDNTSAEKEYKNITKIKAAELIVEFIGDYVNKTKKENR